MTVDFCGIDGCGKTSLIERLMRDPRLARMTIRRAKCDVRTNRERLFESGRFSDPGAFVEGTDAELYALASAFDYLAYSGSVAAQAKAHELLLRDRSHHCFIAYCRSVSERCGALGASLLAGLPEADVTLWIRAEPRVCMARINRRDHGRPFDESIRLLERFDRSYEAEFADHPEVRIVANDDLDRAVEQCVDILLAA